MKKFTSQIGHSQSSPSVIPAEAGIQRDLFAIEQIFPGSRVLNNSNVRKGSRRIAKSRDDEFLLGEKDDH